MKWGHNELAHDLAEHLRQNTARICWEDMHMRGDVPLAPTMIDSRVQPVMWGANNGTACNYQ